MSVPKFLTACISEQHSVEHSASTYCLFNMCLTYAHIKIFWFHSRWDDMPNITILGCARRIDSYFFYGNLAAINVTEAHHLNKFQFVWHVLLKQSNKMSLITAVLTSNKLPNWTVTSPSLHRRLVCRTRPIEINTADRQNGRPLCHLLDDILIPFLSECQFCDDIITE